MSGDRLYALNHYIWSRCPRELRLDRPLLIQVSHHLDLGRRNLAVWCNARAIEPAEGQRLAFDRAKGNCLSCHEINGGDLSGTIGPALKGIQRKYPDRNDLVAILTDETRRNPLTAMPPFGRNRILSQQEIDAIVDFLRTL